MLGHFESALSEFFQIRTDLGSELESFLGQALLPVKGRVGLDELIQSLNRICVSGSFLQVLNNLLHLELSVHLALVALAGVGIAGLIDVIDIVDHAGVSLNVL